MKAKERARALVGDMPWVTERLIPAQLPDFQDQIAACIAAAIAEERDACAMVAREVGEKQVSSIAALRTAQAIEQLIRQRGPR